MKYERNEIFFFFRLLIFFTNVQKEFSVNVVFKAKAIKKCQRNIGEKLENRSKPIQCLVHIAFFK